MPTIDWGMVGAWAFVAHIIVSPVAMVLGLWRRGDDLGRMLAAIDVCIIALIGLVLLLAPVCLPCEGVP